MGLEDVKRLSVSREWGKVAAPTAISDYNLLQLPLCVAECAATSVENRDAAVHPHFCRLLDSSLAWARGVEMANDELGSWLFYWRIFWYLHYSSVESLCSLHLYLAYLEQLYELRVVLSWLFQWSCKEMLGMLITLSWTKSVRNSAQAMAVLQIRLERKRMLNPKQWTIILYQYKHEGTRNAVVVGMEL